MAQKKKGLGKGLDSLIPGKPIETGNGEAGADSSSDIGGQLMNIDKVEPNRDQPRKHFDEDALQELAENIKQYGVLEPLVVRKVDDYYQIVAGERRWRASKKAGLKEVPVVVKDLTDQEAMEISLIENIQREDLNPIEEARAYRKLLDDYNYKQDELADKLSKSRTTITNSIRLLKLDDRVQDMLINDIITSGHARAILGLSDHEEQYNLAQRVFDEKMNVRDVEKEVRRLVNNKPDPEPEKIDPKLQIIYDEMAERMKQILGRKVIIHPKNNVKGKIEIEYYDQDDLNALAEKIYML
ncbi:MAG: ParB/RepB/Spo0J family partition protein [Lachnospiraceae bacterium]|nr:ParB/RepB/Spo0J family partition protein [Lachnospiraceae bacterium]